MPLNADLHKDLAARPAQAPTFIAEKATVEVALKLSDLQITCRNLRLVLPRRLDPSRQPRQ